MAIAAILLATLVQQDAVAQTTYTFAGTTGTNAWSNTASWTGGGSVPGAGDTVLINAGTATLAVNANRSILNLDFSNPAGGVSITTATTATLTITGTLTKSGTATLNFQNLSTGTSSALLSLDIANLNLTGSGGLNFDGNAKSLKGLRVGTMAVDAASNAVAISTRMTSSGTAFIDNLTLNTGRLLTGDSSTVEIKSLAGSGTNGRIQAGNTSGLAIGTLRIVGGSGTSTFGGILDKGGSNLASRLNVVKAGAGVQVLTGSSNLAGDITINGGRLEIGPGGSVSGTAGTVTIDGSNAELRYNTAIGLNKPITFTQGTLSGTGVIATAVTVGSGAILSPGNSPGIQSFTSGLTWAAGGQYTWEINDWAGGVGTSFDQLAVSGSALDISASAGSPFTIRLTSLTAANAAGAVSNFAGNTGRSFTIATSAVPITGFDKTKILIDGTSGFTNVNSLPTGAGFWVSTNAGSTSLLLNYAPSATYNLSAAASASAIRLGGTSTITASILSSTASVTSPDQLAYNGLALSGGVGSLSSTSGTLSPGVSGSGSVGFTGTAAGAFTFTPSVTSGSNVNIGTAANAGSASGVTVSVYNPAAANTLSSPIALGTVLKGTSLSQSLSITNTAPAGSYSEKLDAAFGSLTGAATTNSGSISLLAAQATNAGSMAVGLSTATTGSVSGSVQVNFASNGDGTSGLAPLALPSQTVSLTATVLDPAVASFTSGSTSTSLLLDFGSVNQNASVSPLGFDLFNLLQTSGFTADLALIGIASGTANTGAFTTSLSSTFNNLTAGGSPNSYTASFDTSALGAFSNTYTYSFKSANAGTVYSGDTTQSLTLTLQGVVIVPEPANAILTAIGIGMVSWSVRRRQAL